MRPLLLARDQDDEPRVLYKRYSFVLFALTCLAAALVAATARTAAAADPRCSEAEVRQLMRDFVAAFSRGDYGRLDRLFLVEPEFGWFSSNYPGLRANDQARDRTTLISYFRDRHQHRDTLTLLSLSDKSNGNVTFTLRRQADDYAQGRPFRLVGKGAARCSNTSPSLQVISLGAPDSDKPARRCAVTVATRTNRPPPPVPRSFNYGNTTIAVALSPPNGQIVAGRLRSGGVRATIRADGTIDAKVGWWRAGEQRIHITGTRLDAHAPPLRADVPEGYSRGFQATGLSFPTPGCWRVTGSYGGRSLSFTVLVTLSPLGP